MTQMQSAQDITYLDWAATAPLCSEAYEAMKPYFQVGLDGFLTGMGNANSLYE